jgi:aspartate/methionine/tyrosine aminotransferase
MTVQTPNAFARLRALLADVPVPAGLEPVALHLGECRPEVPEIDPAPLADAEGWTRYPVPGGTAELREAYADWLRRRFRVLCRLDGDRLAIEPTPGSKQAIAVAIALAVAGIRARSGGADAAVVLPNPFYPTYHAATLAVGARPVCYPAGGVDTVSAIADAVYAGGGSVALVVLCNPGNPYGDVAPDDDLLKIARITAEAGAVLLVDECYADLAFARPFPGFLSLLDQAPDGARFLVLHSLAKRSAAPGLRSGFAVGDPSTVAAYAEYNRSCGVSPPLPVCAVAAALWRDDDHVDRLRSLISRNRDLADAILTGLPGYRRPEAGLFVWLPVDDDEAAARELWRRQALSVMPGRYLGVSDATGVNPGAGHLRVALVHRPEPMRAALLRLRRALTDTEEVA